MKKIVSILCAVLILSCIVSPAYAAKKDTKAPTITKTNPEEKGTSVMVEASIVIRFNESIKKGKAIDEITLQGLMMKNSEYTYELKDNLLIITPVEDLKYNKEYTLTIPAAAVKDSSGNSLKKDYTLSFITEENPTKAVETVTTATKYKVEIEADLNGEFTPAMQQYLVSYLKQFGINAKITDVEVLTPANSSKESTAK